MGASAGYATNLDSAGDVITLGTFSGTADFGAESLTGAGGTDLFVTKVDAAGNFLWTIQSSGAASLSTDAGLAVDQAGDLYVSGSFIGVADFGGVQFDASAGADGFVSKLSGTIGSFLWTKQITGDANIRVMGLAVDNAGGLFTAGYHLSAATFGDPSDAGFTILTAAGDNDAFIARLNAATGEVEWAFGFAALLLISRAGIRRRSGRNLLYRVCHHQHVLSWHRLDCRGIERRVRHQGRRRGQLPGWLDAGRRRGGGRSSQYRRRCGRESVRGRLDGSCVGTRARLACLTRRRVGRLCHDAAASAWNSRFADCWAGH